ncbi:MAG: AEC family transporter [Lachnospiraceae bacterium]|nr:AEC family transporter [Lachnospiraceae bacterium]
MDISSLWTLQCMMFLLVAAGAIMKKMGILKAESKGVITDLVISFILPCNIITSFRVSFDVSILLGFAVVLGISVLVQMVSYLISRHLYNRKPDGVKKVLQYCTIVSNSGFLGLPIAEGVFGAEGLMYASIFLIPMRLMMWSAGIACFTESPDMKSVVKKLALHPCIIAVYIGLGLLLFQQPLGIAYEAVLACPVAAVSVLARMAVSALDRMVRAAGGCTTTLTMILIGTMLAEVSPRDLLDKNAMLITVVRLALLPAIVLAGCTLFHVDKLLTGVCVLLTGMPAGSTSAILAAKYHCDYTFATKCIVVSTLLSMLSIPLWCMTL